MTIDDDRVILCPKGPFLVWWGSPTRKAGQALVGPKILLDGWSLPVASEGMRFGALVDLVRRLARKDLQLLEALTGSSIGPFLTERTRGDDVHDTRITVIEVSKDLAVARGSPGGAGPEIRVDLHCCGRTGSVSRPRGYYGLEFTPLVRLRDAVIILARGGRMVDERRRRDHQLFTFRPSVTLGELVTAIVGEICFFGSPRSRDEGLAELDRRARDVDSGKVKTIPAEQVFAKLRAMSAKRDGGAAERRALRRWRARHRGERDPIRSE